MIANPFSGSRTGLCRASALGLFFLLLAGCGGDGGTSPSLETPIDAVTPGDSIGVVDSATTPTDTISLTDPGIVDSTTLSPLAGSAPGIAFGTIQLPTALLSGVQTGTLVGGQISPASVLTWLSAARAKGARVVIKLCRGSDSFVKNSDGTFSFTKWKALVDAYRSVDLAPYIADGTILGHYLIDEPHRTARWGKIIPPATLEAMAKYSKQIWPGMATFVRVAPSWLASSPTTYTYLDAGWLQYESWMGDIGTKIQKEVAAAKAKGLGLGVGLNLLNGGNGSSHISGTRSGQYKMSATEVKNYGTALLNQSLSCGFYNWMYDATYYGRSDIKSAMADLSSKARAHAKTSCRQ